MMLKRAIIPFLMIFAPYLLFAQSYKQLTDSALKIMNAPLDSIGTMKAYNSAYALYKQAFTTFPGQIEKIGYYKAGYLAGELGKTTEAFIYLNKAVDLGFTDMVTWKYARNEFKSIVTDKRWNLLVEKAQLINRQFLELLAKKQRKLEQSGMSQTLKLNRLSAKEAYNAIKAYSRFPPLHNRFVSLMVPLTDSLHSAFLIALPQNYNPHNRYPVLFFLHGAVSSNTGYPDYAEAAQDTGGWNRFYTKYAGNVIMVYPHANADYNWMYPDKGFFMIPAILKQIKGIINVDDNKVFITGHSNGATGSFSYLMKQPSEFAGFYGFNTRPRVATGGTFLRNILNRSYFNISTDKDYYYPPAASDSLAKLMKTLEADYQDHRYTGFPHWFPAFDASEPAFKLLFKDLDKRSRNPFHDKIYWECDDLKYGKCDWLEITALDTAAKRAAWQTNLNYKINKWITLDKNENAIVHDTLVNAFRYPHQSGAIRGTYHNNTFIIETSDVKAFRILLSPEMVDMTNPITIILNGKLRVTRKLNEDKLFMITQFNKTLDRKAVWVNKIDVVAK